MWQYPVNFNIDKYINRIVPRNRLYLLPEPISWFLGYRNSAPSQIENIVVWWWAFIGAFAGILVVEAVFQTDQLRSEGTPIIIASLGAAAILEYHTVESPLAQPRNAVLGQVLSAAIGTGITKLFQHSRHFESLRWVAGALSVGVASAVMGVTQTVHPPGGATALLCSTSREITALGWFLLPLIMLGSSLLVAVACILNNIQRQFPIYWWTPADLGRNGEDDIDRVPPPARENGKLETIGRSGSDTYGAGCEGWLVVDSERIMVPDWLPLEYEERAMLEIMRTKLRQGQGLANMSTENRSTHAQDSRSNTEVE